MTTNNSINAPTPFAISQGGTGVSSVRTTPTASAWAGWDANKNLSGNNVLQGYATTVTAAATTTLTVGDAQQQYFTGTTTQTVVLPVTSTLTLGQSFYIVNNSTGVVTVQSSGANTIKAMAANSWLLVTCILTSGTTAASWNSEYGLQSPTTGPFSSGAGTGSAIGSTALSAGNYGFAMGSSGASAGADGAFCFGTNAAVGASANNSVAIGANATVNANASNAVAIGNGCDSKAANSFTLGTSAVANNAGSFVFSDNNGSNNRDSAIKQFVSTFLNGHFLYTGSTVAAKFLSTGCALLGTNTNDSASAGYVGEFISSVVLNASAVSCTNNTLLDVTSISLTAGDWDIWGNITFNINSTSVSLYGWINSTSATLPDVSMIGLNNVLSPLTGIQANPVPSLRFSLSTTTTIYLSAQASGTFSSVTASGGIYARRIR